MSTWTSRVLLGAAALLLAACDGGIAVGRAAPESITVAGSSVVVGGPRGYCVDPTATRDGTKAFVLLGSCASIARDPLRPRPDVPGIMTVVVSSDPETYVDVTRSAAALERFFRSEPGRATLSRVGQAGTVDILDVRTGGGALYVRARDTSPTPVAGMDDEYWRALLNVNGRLVTVSVVGFTERPMSSDNGLAIVQEATGRIRSESAGLAG